MVWGGDGEGRKNNVPQALHRYNSENLQYFKTAPRTKQRWLSPTYKYGENYLYDLEQSGHPLESKHLTKHCEILLERLMLNGFTICIGFTFCSKNKRH